MKTPFYKILSYITSAAWILLGMLSIISTLLFQDMFGINIIMGIIFISLGYFFYAKSQSMLALNKVGPEHSLDIARIFSFEIVWMILALGIGMLGISGALYRVISEQMPLFG